MAKYYYVVKLVLIFLNGPHLHDANSFRSKYHIKNLLQFSDTSFAGKISYTRLVPECCPIPLTVRVSPFLALVAALHFCVILRQRGLRFFFIPFAVVQFSVAQFSARFGPAWCLFSCDRLQSAKCWLHVPFEDLVLTGPDQYHQDYIIQVQDRNDKTCEYLLGSFGFSLFGKVNLMIPQNVNKLAYVQARLAF